MTVIRYLWAGVRLYDSQRLIIVIKNKRVLLGIGEKRQNITKTEM